MLFGLAAAVWALGRAGLSGVIAAILRIGPGGFAIYLVYSLCVFVILGGSWLATAPGEPIGRLPRFAWARLLREAVADLLPFSQIGGIVVGARSLIRAGVAPARTYASFIADLTTEMGSQLVFTLYGIAMLASVATGGGTQALRPLVIGGVVALSLITLLFAVAQGPVLSFAGSVAERFLPGSIEAIGSVRVELARIYAHRGRLALAFALNLLGWIASAAGAAIVLSAIGARLPLPTLLALEALIFTVRSVAFAVPGAIGFQEAAYALAGPLLGLPAEAALALSLAKRARDVAIGLPAILIWQAGEARGLTSRVIGRR